MRPSPKEFLAELSDAGAALPNRTLFALALAGLRVRLTRSLVTFISVVLAIAYLTFSGSSNALVFNLVTVTGEHEEEVALRLRASGVDLDAVRKAIPDQSLPGPVRAFHACIGSRMDTWLITMALLTCMVGIANAMLMTVTERFREIGTMKCLGAENGTVVKLFLIESVLVGAVGSVAGVLLGLLITLTIGLVQFGGFAVSCLPLGSIALCGAAAFVVGVVLCLVAAGYPALVAARMRPVDALRVEE